MCHKSLELLSLLEVVTSLSYSRSFSAYGTTKGHGKGKVQYQNEKNLSNIHKNLSIMLLNRQDMLSTYRQKVLLCALN